MSSTDTQHSREQSINRLAHLNRVGRAFHLVLETSVELITSTRTALAGNLLKPETIPGLQQ